MKRKMKETAQGKQTRRTRQKQTEPNKTRTERNRTEIQKRLNGKKEDKEPKQNEP